MAIEDRDYQDRAVDEARYKMARLRAQGLPETLVISGPTGSGKTVVGGKIIKGAQAKGTPVAFIADRRELVKQTSERLYEADIPHGVIMAGSTYGSSHLVQVCSAQTLEKRGVRRFGLILVDECHTVRQATVRIIKDWGIPAIGLTATPFTDGLGKIYRDVVNVSTTNQLIEEGWLVPLRVFSATQIDMTGEKPKAGDWTDEQVERRAMPVIGDVVAEWIAGTSRVFGGPVKTLVFTSTVATGIELARKFQEAGYRFEQVSYKTSEEERNRHIAAFRRGELHGLISCEALAKGFDVPDALCLVDARPTNSVTAEIQKLGRVMRRSPGKQFGLVHDHGFYNYARHQSAIESFFAEGVDSLDDGRLAAIRKASRKEVNPEDVLCRGCNMVLPSGAENCPFCGLARPKRRPTYNPAPGYMVEQVPLTEQVGDLWPHVSQLGIERHPYDPTRAQKFAAVQYKELTGRSAWGRPLYPNGACDPRVESQVNKNYRAWQRRRNKKQAVAS